MLQTHRRQSREQRIFSFARLLVDRDDGMPETAAAQCNVDVFHLNSGVFQRAPYDGVARGRGEPCVLPRHVKRVVDGVPSHRNGLNLDQRVPVQPAHEPCELAEAALGVSPARGQDLGLQDNLCIGDRRHLDGLAHRKLNGSAANAPGDRNFVHAKRGSEAGTHHLERVRADGDRDRTGSAGFVGPLGEQPHVIGRHDIDAGQVLLLEHEAVHAGVDSKFRVFRDHHAGGDHGPAVVD